MGKKQSAGLSVKKHEDMSVWYTEVIQKADLADYSDVSGCIIFKPYSYAIWEKIQSEVDKRLKADGIQNVYFPLLIPEKLLQKEAAHVEGFSPEVAWVTHAGDSKLDERLAIRPTSETIMYESYSKWVRSHRDLPILYNQWNNVVRWEFKHPVPFLRTREFLWCEGHTAFATQEEAEKECNERLQMWEEVSKELFALQGVPGRKTDHEKFAGALYTLSIEYFLPNGKAIQGPDAHHDGQNFAKAFDIKFLSKEEKIEYAWQNTWAITTRMIGVLIMVHGDDYGLVLPPSLAPIQTVIIPIIFKDSKAKVLKKAKEIQKSLGDAKLDDREEYSPGWKFNEYELKGVPIRIELGPRDLDNDEVVVSRRDTRNKETVKIKDLKEYVNKTLEAIQKNLLKQSKKTLEDNTVEVKDFKGLKKAIDDKKLALALSCGEKACEESIKEKTGGAKSLNIPFSKKLVNGKCVQCNKEAVANILFGKGY
ncbi:MAG: proline--tRNA ligase [Nanoarchaeota archaeon]|nr:proline--tRNA ligase [Nanoarchaeota archaeon]